jgi:hypothetical protein
MCHFCYLDKNRNNMKNRKKLVSLMMTNFEAYIRELLKIAIVFIFTATAFSQSYYYSGNVSNFSNGRYYSSNYSGYIYVSTPESREREAIARYREMKREAERKKIHEAHIKRMDSIYTNRINWFKNEISFWDKHYRKYDSLGLQGYSRKDFRKQTKNLRKGLREAKWDRDIFKFESDI